MMAVRICASCHRLIKVREEHYNLVSIVAHMGNRPRSIEEFVLCPDCMDVVGNIVRLNSAVKLAEMDEQFDLAIFYTRLEKVVQNMAVELGYKATNTRVSELLAYVLKKIRLEKSSAS